MNRLLVRKGETGETGEVNSYIADQEVRALIRDELEALGVWQDPVLAQTKKVASILGALCRQGQEMTETKVVSISGLQPCLCVRLDDATVYVYQEPNGNWMGEFWRGEFSSLVKTGCLSRRVFATGDDIENIARHIALEIVRGPTPAIGGAE